MRLLTLCIFSLLTIGCGSKDVSERQPQRIAQAETPLLQPAWLADRVSDEALAYFRLPSPFGLTSAPKDNRLGQALGSEAHVTLLNDILSGLDAQITAILDGEQGALASWFMTYPVSPIEVMFAPMPGVKIKAPVTIASVQTRLRTAPAAAAAAQALINATPIAAEVSFDDDGIASVDGAPVPIAMSFDETTGRLLLMVGNGVSAERMLRVRDALTKPLAENPMTLLHDRIDSSGQGLISWINVEQALTFGQMLIPAEVFSAIREAGLEDARAIAMGYGVSRGKARLALLADVPSGVGFRDLLPKVDNTLTIPVTDAPRYVVTLALPSSEDIRRIALATGQVSDDDYTTTMRELQEEAGFDLEALVALLDGELVYVSESVGGYWALRISDRDAFLAAIDRFGEETSLFVESRAIDGMTVHHLRLSAGVGEDDDTGLDDPAVRELVGRIGYHYFWAFDGDYASFADTPQTLLDRKRRGASTTVADWLETTQQHSLDNALFGITGGLQGVPRNAYNNYLSMLLLMTDIADIDVGVWSLPSADQLALPDRGTLGISVIADEQLLGVEMVSEHSLFDVVGGNAYGGVAIFGVLAAIAIPAYQDYTIRSQVSEGLSLSSFQKVAVAESYLASGRWPNATEAGEMAAFDLGEFVSQITVEPGSGAIEITYGLGANIGIVGQTLTMTPLVIEGDNIVWRCASTIDEKWLPAVCRDSSSLDEPVLALPET